MSKTSLSDEEMYSTLEAAIDTIIRKVPTGDQETSPFPDRELLEQLQQQGYDPKTSWAFLRACHWHLADKDIMIIDPSNRYYLSEKITEENKTDLCLEIFSEYEKYLRANYERSLIEPNPYLKPEKAPDSSPGFTPKSYFSGGK